MYAALSQTRKAAAKFVAVVDALKDWPDIATMVQCADAKLGIGDARLLAEALRQVEQMIVDQKPVTAERPTFEEWVASLHLLPDDVDVLRNATGTTMTLGAARMIVKFIQAARR